MKLLLDLIRWLLGKAVLVVIIVVSLVVLTVFWGSLSQTLNSWIAGAKKWPQEVVRLEKRLQEVTGKLRKAQAELDFCESKSPPWYDVIGRWKQDKCQHLRDQLEHLKKRQRNLESTLAWMQQDSWRHLYVLRDALYTNLSRILLIVGFVLIGPPFWKALMFFGLGRFAEAAPPLRLSHDLSEASLAVSRPERQFAVSVGQQISLSARHAHIKQYDTHLGKRTRLFWRWSAPLLSYGAGLFQLSEVFVKGRDGEGTVVLGSEQPDRYIVALTLVNHPGVVIHPRYIVGISGNINPKAKWIVRNLHCWLTGQLRYYSFFGTGCVYVEAPGGIKASGASPTVGVEERLVVGFDSRLAYSTRRTETFWPYLIGKVPLIDDQFEGRWIFLTRVASTTEPKNAAIRNLELFLSAVGKFFGF